MRQVKQQSRTQHFKKPQTFAQRIKKTQERTLAIEAEKKFILEAKNKRAIKAKRIQAKRDKRKQEDLRKGNVQVVKKLGKLDRRALNKLIKMTSEQIQSLAK